MKLRHLTFTGADDRTDILAMLDVSRQVPRVGWAILVSPSRIGTPRYPSEKWFDRFADARDEIDANAALHFCGHAVRRTMEGEAFPVRDPEDTSAPFRIQLNLRGRMFVSHMPLDLTIAKHPDFSWICTIGGLNDHIFHGLRDAGLTNVSPLFDRSGGEGVTPDSWPAPIDGVLCGYAGGLGPDNLADELKRLEDVVGDREIWVDMETKVRNEADEFDLDKIKRCIEIAAPYL